MSKSTPPPGTSDILPEEAPTWNFLEDSAKKIFSLYGYGELRTPIFEYTEVFQRGLGNETEVVKKEMYTFEDRGGRSLTLRPEGTAGVMRSLSGTDAECIAMLVHFLNEIKISGFTLYLNTRGVASDRPAAEEALRNYFAPYIDSMCDDCKERFQRNIWRILDCKQEKCRKVIDNAPDAASFFSQESRDYFKKVCDALTAMGIDYVIEPRLVRGLDYYVHTVFELTHPGLGGQTAIAGGGRYELMLPESNKPIQGVGFAAGMERLIMVREALGVPPVLPEHPRIFLASMGEKALAFNIALSAKLRKAGIATALELETKSLKSQMRSADRLKAAYSIVVGDSELESGKAMLKNMADSSQQEVKLSLEDLKEKLC